MAHVNVNRSVSIHLEEEEKEILLKSYEVLKNIRHEIFQRDDDSELYWCVSSTVDNLEDLLGEAKVMNQ